MTENAKAGGVVQGGSSHHAAAGQEPVPVQRAHPRAQGQGSVPRALAGDATVEERNPASSISTAPIWAAARSASSGRAVLLRQVGQGPEPGRGGDARRPVQGADEICAARQPAGRARPRQRGARQHGPGRLHDRRPGVRRPAQSRYRGRPARRARRPTISSTGPSTR